MDKISVSKFKATCLAIIEMVSATGAEVIVTKHGKPVAKLVPLNEATAGGWLGCASGSADILADLAEASSGLDPNAAALEWQTLTISPRRRGRKIQKSAMASRR